MEKRIYFAIARSESSAKGYESLRLDTEVQEDELFPQEVIKKAWDVFKRPFYLHWTKRGVPSAGVFFNQVSIDKTLTDEECRELKEKILRLHQDKLTAKEVYVLNGKNRICILNFAKEHFNILSGLSETAGCQQFRYYMVWIHVTEMPKVL